MTPFENTLPYDSIMGDIYLAQCPFCLQRDILIPLKPQELPEIQEGKKKLVVFPCCRNHIIVINVDSNYLLANKPVRRY